MSQIQNGGRKNAHMKARYVALGLAATWVMLLLYINSRMGWAQHLRPPFKDPYGGVIYVGQREAVYVGWIYGNDVAAIKQRQQVKVVEGLGMVGTQGNEETGRHPIYIEIAHERGNDVMVYVERSRRNQALDATPVGRSAISANNLMKCKESWLVPEPKWENFTNGGVEIWWRPVAMANDVPLFLAVFKAENRTEIERVAVGIEEHVEVKLNFLAENKSQD